PGGELLLRLPMELRAHDARGEREAGALPEVLGDDLHALGRERPRVDKGGERRENAGAEARLVRAAGARRDKVDVAVGEGLAIGDPADRPRGAFAGLDVADAGERFLVEVALAGEKRRDQLASGEHEVEVLRHATGVRPAFG